MRTRAEAISLAPASPCNAFQQCTHLALVQPTGDCPAPDDRPYSLASATADAGRAAAPDERALADHAIAIAPAPRGACSQSTTLPPGLACVANTCQVAAPAQ